jgi:hypothetical protein
MKPLPLCQKSFMLPLAACVFLCCAFAAVMLAAPGQTPKKTPPAPKAAAAPKPAAASHPATNTGAASHGATTASTARAGGPTTNGAHPTGPTANGTHATGAMANGTHAGPTTANVPHGIADGVGSRNTAMNRTATGRIAPAGSRTIQTRNGAVTRRPDGRVSDVHDARRGMDVHHGLDGGRRVSVMRADHSRIVAERGRRGFVERRYSFRGHDFARRSYYWHGRAYDRYYRGYYYHGVMVNVYAPAVYYPPAFYGWAYNPWAVPVAYGWGWAGTPWYGFYGAYFVPYPVYAGPAFWLADYVMATQLEAAYAAQTAAAAQAAVAAGDPPPGAAPMLTPEIKAEIADEVKAQIALENAEGQQNTQGQDVDPASSSIARVLSDGHSHVFVVGDGLDVTDANNAECALSEGDVLQFSGPPPADNATDVNLTVVAGKGSGKECQRSDTVIVAVADLQEMQNHLRETVDQGMQELRSKQGQGGLPAAPPSAQAASTQSAFTQAAPPPEQNGAADVNQQLAEGDKAEQEATQEAAAAPAQVVDVSATAQPQQAATVNIALGQTIDQVTSALGSPQAVIDLGSKKIYKYKDMKITFKDGKVSDVE